MHRVRHTRRVATFLAAASLMATVGTGLAVDFSGWAKRTSVTFSGYTKGETLTNFPVLVTLGTAITNFSYADFASTSGGDLRFSDAAGTELNYEIDEWNTGGVSYVWVQVPLLASTNDFIWAYWGNGSQAIAPAYTTNGATWTGKYLGVWHFNQVGGGVNLSDSGVNRWASTNYGSTVAANGPGCSSNVSAFVGHGQQFIAANNGCLVTGARDSLLLPTAVSPVSYSFWCNLRSYVTDGRAVNLHRSTSPNWGSILNNTYQSSGPKMRVNYYNGGLNGTDYTPSPATGVWHFVTTVYDGAAVRMYLNGAQVLSTNITFTDYGNPSNTMTIGNAGVTNTISGDQILDEVRVAPAVLSSNWVWATWHNAASNAAFCAYGAASNQTATLPNIATLPAANVTGPSADLIGNLITNGNSAATVYVFWGPTDGDASWGTWANTNTLGTPSPGLLTNHLTSLAYGASYTYRYYATNLAGDCWGGAQSFTTLGPPSIVIGSASPLTPVSATLNATLTSTGAASTTVYAYWDISDKSTNADSWANPITVGVSGYGPVSAPIVGLTAGQTYHCRFRAVNTYGDVWTADGPFTAPNTYVWAGNGGDNNWSTGPNWDNGVAPQNDGTANVAFSGSNRPTPVADTAWNVQALSFTNLGTAFTLSGSAITLQSGGLSNANTTTGRNVTISNSVTLSGTQMWGAADPYSSVTILAGNLGGSGNLTLSPAGLLQASGDGSLPSFRFGGNNGSSGGNYTGNLVVGAAQRTGLLLMNPGAMISGNISLGTPTSSNDRRYLYLSGSSSGAPFTFGIGTAAGQVSFNNNGNASGGLLHDGNQWLRLGGNGNYTWNNSTFYVEGRVSGTAGVLTLGNAADKLILAGTFDSNVKTFRVEGTAAVDLQYGLDDTGLSGKTFRKTGSGLLILNAAASGAQTTVIGVNNGVLSVSNMNQVFAGDLEIGNNNGSGVFAFNGLSWSDFTSNRSGGYGAGGNQWQLSGTSPGFAARGAATTIDGTQTTDKTFDRDFQLGSYLRDTNGLLYAAAPVVISQNITLSNGVDRTWTFQGGNSEQAGSLNAWALEGPVHEISGKITGGAVSRQLRFSGSGTGGARQGGTVRLSNPLNDYVATNILGVVNNGELVVVATDDGVFGNPVNSVILSSGGNGPDALLLFEDRGGTGKTFGRAVAANTGDNSSNQSGLGSYGGQATYTGRFSRIDNGPNTTVIYANTGSRFILGNAGTAAVLAHSGTQNPLSWVKQGLGEVVLSNVTYQSGSNTSRWTLTEGTLTTTADPSGTSNPQSGLLRSGGPVSWADIAQVLNTTNARTWAIRSSSQTYTNMVGGGWSGQFTIDVATNLALKTYTLGALSPQENGATDDTPAWDMIKTGPGTWLFWNGNLTFGYGRMNVVRVNQGVFDVTGDMGRGGLGLNGGTVLAGVFSPFSSQSGTQRLRIMSGGGKLGISPSATGDVSRTDAITSWDQSSAQTVTLAARNNYNLIFNNSSGVPNLNSNVTLLVERDGAGTGEVRFANTTWTNAGTLGGSGTLRLTGGAISSRVVTVSGTLSPGSSATAGGTLTLTNEDLVLTPASVLNYHLGVIGSSDTVVVGGNLTLAGTLNVTGLAGYGPGTYVLMTYTGNLTGPGLTPGILPKRYVKITAGNGQVLLTVGTTLGMVLSVY